jgi:predicted PurR-regulated permease PerM
LAKELPVDNELQTETESTQPNIDDLKRAFQGPLGIRSLALTGLFVLACFYTLYFAAQFFLPIVLAVVLSFLLQPIVRGLKRLHIPEAVGAGLVIAGLLIGISLIVYQLAAPVADWVAKAPALAKKLEQQVREYKKPVERVTKAGEQVEQLTSMGQQKPTQTVELKRPGLVETVFSQTFKIVFGGTVLVILLYFLLASGDLFLRKVIRVLPRLDDKKRAVQIARDIETNVSAYLFTQAMINLAMGVSSAVAFYFLGMPSPLLWGVMIFLFHFVPYVGPLTNLCVVTLVATATFSESGRTLLPPIVYLCLAVIEGNLVTPWVMGRRLTLNPVVVFVALIFWGWLWGIAGALLAVPMLAMLKIFCDHIEPLAPIGEFLGS